MWSAGLVLYMMLSGKHPFQSDEYYKTTITLYIKTILSIRLDDLIEEIKVAKIDFNDESWDSVSSEAKDLIMKLLQKDFTKRFSPFDALSHPWIMNVS